WREVGLRMGIRDIPADYPELEHYNIDYERRHYRYTETNARVGAATVELFASWFPHSSRPLVRRAIYALLDEALIDGFGFPHPSARRRRLAGAGFRMRARFAGGLPARRRPRLRTEMTHPSYPHGYRIEELGPPVQRAANTEASPTRTA